MNGYFIIIKKEILEITRDKSSLFMSLILTLIMPVAILLYGFQIGEQHKNVLISERAISIAPIVQDSGLQYKITELNPVDLISDNSADVGIDYTDGTYSIIYQPTDAGLTAMQSISKLLKLQIFSSDNDINGEFVSYTPIVSEQNSPESMLVSIIPSLLLFSIITGNGTGIAVNIFAGEKERGSYETLLLTQVNRETLFFAKLTTVALSMLTGSMVYAVAIFISVKFMALKTGIQIIKIGISEFSLLIIYLLLFSLLAAAYISIVSLKAHNVREAQLSTMLFSLLICGVGFALNSDFISINPFFIPMIPVVNVIQSLEELLKGDLHLYNVVMTCATNILFTFLGIKIGSRIMNEE